MALGATGAVLLLAFPFIFRTSFSHHTMILILMYALMAQSWNVVAGFSGQISLGHAIFFGIGAYSSTVLFAKYGITPWVGLLVGIADLDARCRRHRRADAAPARPLLCDRHATDRLERADRIPALGLGRCRLRSLRADQSHFALALPAVPHQQGALLLPRAGGSGGRLFPGVEAASQPFRLPTAGAAGRAGCGSEPRHRHRTAQSDGVHDLRRHDVGRRHLLRPICPGAGPRAAVLRRDLHHRPAHDRARRQRHAVGAGAGSGNPRAACPSTAASGLAAPAAPSISSSTAS